MTKQLIIDQNPVLTQCPEANTSASSKCHIIGDLHGNTLKAIYFMVRHGVIRFSDKDKEKLHQDRYQELVAIYERHQTLIDIAFCEVESRVACERHSNTIGSLTHLIKYAEQKLGKTEDSAEKEKLEAQIKQYKIEMQQQKKIIADLENLTPNTAVEKLQEDIENFNFIMGKIRVTSDAKVIWIGDEFADRGSQDYFTLKFFDALKEKGVQSEFLFSNHSAGFLKIYQQEESFSKPKKFEKEEVQYFGYDGSGVAPYQSTSLHNMGFLVAAKLIKCSDVNTMTEGYSAQVKLLSYSFDTTVDPVRMTIYSHAPTNPQNIQNLIKVLNEPDLNPPILYNDTSPATLAATIDQINKRFQNILKEKKLAQYLYKGDTETALHDFVWDRLKGYTIPEDEPCDYVYGHTTPENKTNTGICLDSDVGKTSNSGGTYTALISNETTDISAQHGKAFVVKPQGFVESKKLTDEETVSPASPEAKTPLVTPVPSHSSLLESAKPQNQPQPALKVNDEQPAGSTGFVAGAQAWCSQEAVKAQGFVFDQTAGKISKKRGAVAEDLIFIKPESLIFAKTNDDALTAGASILQGINQLNIRVSGGTQEEKQALLQKIAETYPQDCLNITVINEPDNVTLTSKKDITNYLERISAENKPGYSTAYSPR